MTPQLDLYGNIGEIRDALDTLLKRGKPASVADLQTLMASVETKSRPTLTFPASEAARLLAPQLLPLLPTPDNLAAAGKHAAALIEAGIEAGSRQSIDQVTACVQESTRQLAAAADALTKAAETVPRSVRVDFLQGWRWPTGLVVGPVVLLLLVLWLGGAFSGVAQAKYDQVQQQKKALTQANEKLLTEGRFYLDQVQRYRKKFPKAASYFPAYMVPAVVPAIPQPAAK
jgi:hypothetical protein